MSGIWGAQRDAFWVAADGGNGGAEARLEGAVADDAGDIFPRAALDGAPLRPVADLEQAMVLEEANEGLGRIIPHVARSRRPDGARHGQQVAVPEVVGITLGLEEIAQGDVIGERRQLSQRCLEEARNVAHQLPVAGVQQVLRLAHQLGEAGPGVFIRSPAHRDGKAHVGGGGRHLKAGEQRGQVGVGRRVVDDEAGVDRDIGAVHLAVDGVGVAAGTRVGLDQGHAVGS